MIKAVCPGSFDPITKGHVDIITRAAVIFDEVVVLISDNPEKKYTFNFDERKELADMIFHQNSNVKIDILNGLLADYMRKNGANVVVRGLRAMSDFEYEFQMALTNRELNPDFETIFLSSALNNTYLSSSMVKQICSLGGDISNFVPPQIINKIKWRYEK